MKLQKILVPLDFSACAVNALRYAMNIAQQLGPDNSPELILLHSYHIHMPVADVSYAIDSSMDADYKKEAHARFNQLEQDLPELARLRTRRVIEMSLVLDLIMTTIEQEAIDLIVMGTQGENSFLDKLLGSITQGVINQTECPVLAVPEQATAPIVQKIAFACDYNPTERTAPLDVMKTLAQLYAAEIHVVNVNKALAPAGATAASEALAMEYFLKDVPHSWHMAENEEVVEGLNDYITNHSINMLVVMPRKHGLFHRLFKQSVTKKLAAHAQIPLLAIHE